MVMVDGELVEQGGPEHEAYKAQRDAETAARQQARYDEQGLGYTYDPDKSTIENNMINSDIQRDAGRFVCNPVSPMPCANQYNHWLEQNGMEGLGTISPGVGGDTYTQDNVLYQGHGERVVPEGWDPTPTGYGDQTHFGNLQAIRDQIAAGPVYREGTDRQPGGPGGPVDPGPLPGSNPWGNWLANAYAGGSYAGNAPPPAQPGAQVSDGNRVALTQALMQGNWNNG